MDVLNIRLNSMASERSLPVIGDFMSCFRMMAFISSLVMPSSCGVRFGGERSAQKGSCEI